MKEFKKLGNSLRPWRVWSLHTSIFRHESSRLATLMAANKVYAQLIFTEQLKYK